MTYRVTKHYPHSLGLSASFRQHRASSHCKFVHGYALAFTFIFEARDLDSRNWVIDFGDLKNIKKYLEQTFDHKLCLANDDPLRDRFLELELAGGCEIVELERVGCESFAELAGKFVVSYLNAIRPAVHDGVRLVSAECAEHEGNSATWLAPMPAYIP